MKITAVKGFPFKVGHRNNYVVKIETDAGISGVGEGGISGRELAMQGALAHFARVLIGMDPRRIEHIWQRLYRRHYFEGDAFPLPTAPGLGIVFNEEAVADHPFELWDAPHFRRRDGAFTNW